MEPWRTTNIPTPREGKKLNKEKKESKEEPKYCDTYLPIAHAHTCSITIFSTDQKETAIQWRLHSSKFNSTYIPFQRLENPNVFNTF